ncbi:Uncharacterised protein [Mycobacteroides abscessus subsp. abscessus]|nr:Uncharacterised protein [Mycobacteroides abscessus subsp. abscessus]
MWAGPVLWAAVIGFLVGVLLAGVGFFVSDRIRHRRAEHLPVREQDPADPPAAAVLARTGYVRWVGKFVILMQQATRIAARSTDPELVSLGQRLDSMRKGLADWLPLQQIADWPASESFIRLTGYQFSSIERILLSPDAPATPPPADGADTNWATTSFTLFDIYAVLKEEFFDNVASAAARLVPR